MVYFLAARDGVVNKCVQVGNWAHGVKFVNGGEGVALECDYKTISVG